MAAGDDRYFAAVAAAFTPARASSMNRPWFMKKVYWLLPD
jgi:hypothetical protein